MPPSPEPKRLLRLETLIYLRQRGLRLGEPEGHLHGSEQLHSAAQRSIGLLPPSRRDIEPTQPVLTVGLERTHAERLGQGEGLLVVRGGGHDVGGIVPRGNLAEQPQGPCLPALPVAVAGVGERPLRQLVGLLHTPGAEIRLPPGEEIGGGFRFPTPYPQHRAGIRRAASQGIGQRQMHGRYIVKV